MFLLGGMFVSIQSIAKSLAAEVMKTKEYKTMMRQKSTLYNNPNFGAKAKLYEQEQLKIIQSKSSPTEKQIKMNQLQKQSSSLLHSREMMSYQQSVNEFQQKVFQIFQILNQEINKSVTR